MKCLLVVSHSSQHITSASFRLKYASAPLHTNSFYFTGLSKVKFDSEVQPVEIQGMCCNRDSSSSMSFPLPCCISGGRTKKNGWWPPCKVLSVENKQKKRQKQREKCTQFEKKINNGSAVYNTADERLSCEPSSMWFCELRNVEFMSVTIMKLSLLR